MSPLVLPADAALLAPKDVARLVAEDLARVLPGGPWAVTQGRLRATDGEQVTDIILQRLRGSWTGVGVWISPRLTVRDARLAGWRREQSGVVDSQDGVLFNSLLINISHVSCVEVLTAPREDTTPRMRGAVTYDAFVTEMTKYVLPNRDLLCSPRTVLDLPVEWLWHLQPLVEWCVATGHAELAWPLVERGPGSQAASRLAFVRGFNDGRVGRPVQDEIDTLSRLGDLMARLSQTVGPAPSWVEEAVSQRSGRIAVVTEADQ